MLSKHKEISCLLFIIHSHKISSIQRPYEQTKALLFAQILFFSSQLLA